MRTKLLFDDWIERGRPPGFEADLNVTRKPVSNGLLSLSLRSRFVGRIHVNSRHHACVWDLSQIPCNYSKCVGRAGKRGSLAVLIRRVRISYGRIPLTVCLFVQWNAWSWKSSKEYRGTTRRFLEKSVCGSSGFSFRKYHDFRIRTREDL